MTGRRVECRLKWCNEVGEHGVHRQYVVSMSVWRGAWLIGVNVAQPAGRSAGVELTVTTRRGVPAVVPLGPGEAVTVGEALIEAAQRATKAASGRVPT